MVARPVLRRWRPLLGFGLVPALVVALCAGVLVTRSMAGRPTASGATGASGSPATPSGGSADGLASPGAAGTATAGTADGTSAGATAGWQSGNGGDSGSGRQGGGHRYLIAVLSDHNVSMAAGIATVEQITTLTIKALRTP